MPKYACPLCGYDTNVEQIGVMSAGISGHFDEHGDWIPKGRYHYVRKSFAKSYYWCNDCHQRFDQPAVIG